LSRAASVRSSRRSRWRSRQASTRSSAERCRQRRTVPHRRHLANETRITLSLSLSLSHTHNIIISPLELAIHRRRHMFLALGAWSDGSPPAGSRTKPLVGSTCKRWSGNPGQSPPEPRLLRKCHRILYCRDAVSCRM